jgi:hypothetical protein
MFSFSGKQIKILKPIIKSIFIDVMDYLERFQVSVESFLGDKDMLLNISGRILSRVRFSLNKVISIHNHGSTFADNLGRSMAITCQSFMEARWAAILALFAFGSASGYFKRLFTCKTLRHEASIAQGAA